LGLAPRQQGLFGSTAGFCQERVGPGSVYGFLHRECRWLFPDEMFADLFTDVGRRSVPPMIVAVVMVLQRLEGLSDREAVDRFCFDVRWKYAAGGLDFDYPGFVHTVLVDMRARLARSDAPSRIFDVVLQAAAAAGLVGRRRVLDSTPIYDAVATMDTVTLVRSAIRGLLAVADAGLAAELRAVLARDDDYAGPGKPVCDYDDPVAREQLVDGLARDGLAVLQLLEGRVLDLAVRQAADLLATVIGQDLGADETGMIRIVRRVARDRVISTVDPQTRHGHKTAARGFDGYKGHVGIDPDSEIITATRVSPGNAGDASVAEELIADLLPEPATAADTNADDNDKADPGQADPGQADPGQADAAPGGDADGGAGEDPASVYGDNAYGTGEFQERLAEAGLDSKCKTQRPTAAGGLFTKDAFTVDLDSDTVTCPNGKTAEIRRNKDGSGAAQFGPVCAGCPLRAQCTKAVGGRSIKIGRHQRRLAEARQRQTDPDWIADYRATRPKVERKIAHLMRRRHGGRRARVRGHTKIAADFALLTAAVNLARLGILGVTATVAGSWRVAPN
jgi:DDE family transposase/transposase-like protein DUF772